MAEDSNVFAESPLTWFADGAHIDVGLLVENVGKTPARFVLAEIAVEVSIGKIEDSEAYKRMVESAKAQAFDYGHTIFPEDELEDKIPLRIADTRSDVEGRGPVLMCCVSYKNPLDGTVHQTGAAVLVE